MKKLLLIAAATAALSSTALAEGENTFYLKANIGGNMMNKATDKATGLKLKAKTAVFFGLGAGSYLMDNVRADLDLTVLTNPELKKSGQNANKNQVTAKHKGNIVALLVNGYVDIFDASIAKVFVGAGVGMAQVKEKISLSDAKDAAGSIVTAASSASSKKKNNVAYQLTLGAGLEVAPGANAELSYSWKDFGKTKAKAGQENFGTTHYKGHNIGAGIRFEL